MFDWLGRIMGAIAKKLASLARTGAFGVYDFEWVPIVTNDVTLFVTHDAVKVAGVRIIVSAREAQQIADDLGAMLTTPKIEDLIYAQADVHLEPMIGDPAKTTAAQHSKRIDDALAGRSGLIATVGKSWVLSKKATSAKAVNYGWHTKLKAKSSGPWPSVSLPGVNVWQQPSTAHNLDHRDYSQTLRLVRADARVNGETRQLAELLASKEYAPLLSHEGALTNVRQPGVPLSSSSEHSLTVNPSNEYPTVQHWARAVIVAAFHRQFGREPSLLEAQFGQAIGALETSYGRGWKNAGVGSHNWGAVQAHRPPCGDDSFLYTDSHPNADGTSTRYDICFKRYADDVAGAADMLRIMYRMAGVKESANAGDIHGVSKAMYDSHYYQGFGATREARIDGHAKAVTARLQTITKALGEPMPTPSSGVGGAIIAGIGIVLIGGIAWLVSRGGA